MRTKILGQAGLFLLSIATQVTASVFFIDTVSCNNDQQNFLRTALSGAFAMAQAGVDAASSPLGQAQANLINALFGGTDQTRIDNINTYLGTETGVLKFNNEVDGQQFLAPEDIKFYCDQSRLKTRIKDPLHYYDSDIERAVPINSKIDCVYNLMYTLESQNDHNIFKQIQVCPWLLKYSMAAKFKTHADLSPGLQDKMASGLPSLLQQLFYKPIDILSLFDKCFLHEMTHALEKGVEDIGGQFKAYGWKNCRRLSTVITDMNADPQILGPELNSDTWALFGSAALLIQEGGTVNADGTITGPP